jgi:DNA-binding GntR family transcriptional regulator
MLTSVGAEPERRRNLGEIRKEHKMLMEALAGGDKAYIKETFETHILDAMNRIIRYLRKMREKDGEKQSVDTFNGAAISGGGEGNEAEI